MTIDMLLIIPQVAFDIVLAIAVALGRTHGGLTFCRIGRFGFSFYMTKKRQQPDYVSPVRHIPTAR